MFATEPCSKSFRKQHFPLRCLPILPHEIKEDTWKGALWLLFSLGLRVCYHPSWHIWYASCPSLLPAGLLQAVLMFVPITCPAVLEREYSSLDTFIEPQPTNPMMVWLDEM